MPTDVLLVGAGGHAKVVADAAKASSCFSEIVISDQNEDNTGKRFLNNYRIFLLDDVCEKHHFFHVAIGDNQARKTLTDRLNSLDKTLLSIVHPAAVVSNNASIGDGSFVAAGSIVTADAMIGDGVVINHNAVIDHDCVVESYSHIAPSATLGGGVTVGENTLVGAGAILLPFVKVGSNVIIGAGSVVNRDVPSGSTIVGVPGKTIK